MKDNSAHVMFQLPSSVTDESERMMNDDAQHLRQDDEQLYEEETNMLRMKRNSSWPPQCETSMDSVPFDERMGDGGGGGGGGSNTFKSLLTPEKSIASYAKSSPPSLALTSFDYDEDEVMDIGATCAESPSKMENLKSADYSFSQDPNNTSELTLNALDEDIYCYPSGRLPLVPISQNSAPAINVQESRNDVEQKKVQKKCDDREDNCQSWSLSLCSLPSKAALDNIRDETEVLYNPSRSTEDSFVKDFVDDSVDINNLDDDKLVHGEDKPCSKKASNKKDNSFEQDEVDTNDVPLNNSATSQEKKGQDTIACVRGNDCDGNTSLVTSNMWCTTTWDDWQDDASIHGKESESKELKSQLRNRACNKISRRRKIHQLRINMAPFECRDTELIEAAINRGKYSPIAINKKIHSLTAIDPKRLQQETNQYEDLVVQPSKNFKWDTCGIDAKYLESAIVSEEEDLLYDSDPSEILHERRVASRTKRKNSIRHKSVTQRLSVQTNQEFEGTPNFQKMIEVMTKRIILVWHDTSTSDGPPHAVKAWIELGSQLQSTLIQPKFMWQETCSKTQNAIERSVLNTLEVHAIDLLDITRIVVMNQIDRSKYPFAKQCCSFIIFSFEKQLLFEAESEKERDDIVNGLKTVVARLGSKILVGDGDVLNEFFTPIGAAVPGDAPAFFD